MGAKNDRGTTSRSKAARALQWALWSTLGVLAACGTAVTESPPTSGYTNDGVPSSEGGTEGLPCEVSALLEAKCTSCHSNPTANFAPMPLVTYADLTAPSLSEPTESTAALCLERMKSTTIPMPPAPAPPATAAEIAAFEAWVTAGTPKTACATGN